MYASGKVIYPGEPLMFEEMGHLQTTTAVMTDHNDVGVLIKLGISCRNGPHRHVLGGIDTADFPFPGFADVKENWPRARWVVEPSLELGS